MSWRLSFGDGNGRQKVREAGLGVGCGWLATWKIPGLHGHERHWRVWDAEAKMEKPREKQCVAQRAVTCERGPRRGSAQAGVELLSVAGWLSPVCVQPIGHSRGEADKSS